MKKVVLWSLVILVFLFSFLYYWNYVNTYSEGNRAGILQKFSKRGNLFKTYEGELIMSSISITNNTILASEKFYFSVKDDSVANTLFNMEGKRVSLHYQQKRKH